MDKDIKRHFYGEGTEAQRLLAGAFIGEGTRNQQLLAETYYRLDSTEDQ